MIHTLILTKSYPHRASYYDDWIDAFNESSLFNVDIFNILKLGAKYHLAKIIKHYEVIILLHACTADSIYTISSLSPILKERRGKLITFMGNEYNSPDNPLGNKIAFLQEVDADYIGTFLLPECGQWLYEKCRGKVISMPHALNPTAFYPKQPIMQRRIDLGVRGYRYLSNIGDRDRNQIMDFFEKCTQTPALKLDFSTKERFNRKNWNEFLNNCRGTVSTEAGSHYLERSDATVMAIRHYALAKLRGISLSNDSIAARLARRLPYAVKSKILSLLHHSPVVYTAAVEDRLDYEEIFEKFFNDLPPCPHYSKVISSRHFDVIGTKTIQIMFPGRYNDILIPNRHYIELQRDFSNINDVMMRFHDTQYVKKMGNETYDYVMDTHTYSHRMHQLYDILR